MSIVAEFISPRKASVANRLMVFPQEVRQADQYVAFWWDVIAGVDETRQAAAYKADEMGLQALVLAKDIRKAFNLPGRDLVFGGCLTKPSADAVAIIL